MKKKKNLTNELKIIAINRPTPEEAKLKIQRISEILSKKGVKLDG